VDFKIRFFNYVSAAATAESIPGRGFVKCVCGTWYSYAVVDKMHGQTLVGQSHVRAPVAAKAPQPVVTPLTAWATIEDDASAGRRHRTLGSHDLVRVEAMDLLNVSAAEMWAAVEKQRRLEEGTD